MMIGSKSRVSVGMVAFAAVVSIASTAFAGGDYPPDAQETTEQPGNDPAPCAGQLRATGGGPSAFAGQLRATGGDPSVCAGWLPATGGDSDETLRIAGGAVIAGVGLLGVARFKRRLPAV